jgi:hypothetical protein
MITVQPGDVLQNADILILYKIMATSHKLK